MGLDRKFLVRGLARVVPESRRLTGTAGRASALQPGKRRRHGAAHCGGRRAARLATRRFALAARVALRPFGRGQIGLDTTKC